MSAQAIEHTDASVSVPTAYLKEALTACLLSAAKSTDSLSVLQSVQLTAADGELVLTSTDRHRLTRATVKTEGTESFTALLSAADAKRLAQSLTVPRYSPKAYPAWFAVQDDKLTVATLEGSSTFLLVEGDYPKVDRIIAKPDTAPEPVAYVGFDPRFMADLCKMPRDKRAPVVLDFNTPNKPIRAEWETEGAQYLHIIMPTRVTGRD